MEIYFIIAGFLFSNYLAYKIGETVGRVRSIKTMFEYMKHKGLYPVFVGIVEGGVKSFSFEKIEIPDGYLERFKQLVAETKGVQNVEYKKDE